MIDVYYWAPCIDKVATIKAVINSSLGLKTFFSKNTKTLIINSIGEWNNYKKKELNFYNLTNTRLFKYLPIKGFIGSRFTYLVIILFSIIPLLNLLIKKKPQYIIIHLLTSLPIILFIFFNFKTKLILRVSGLPKLNFFRKFLWKCISPKIFQVTCPTRQTYEDLKKYGIFDEKKLKILYDPVIKLSDYRYKNTKSESKEKFIISIGRLTKQKNHKLLINFFHLIEKRHHDLKLIICGEGEEMKNLKYMTKRLNLKNKIIFMGHVDNVKTLMKKSLCMISTSLWEDPGFVMIESAMSNTFIISSNCPNGPKEFIKNDDAGILFESNDIKSLEEKFEQFMNLSNREIFKKKFNAKNNAKKYTLFNHSRNLYNILN